jgi:hypothetical protein
MSMKVLLPDGETIRIAGPVAKGVNALKFANNVMAASKPVMGLLNAVATPLQIADQIIDANNSDQMISQYRGSDPFSIRPYIDMALDATGAGGTNAKQGFAKYNKLVNSPEYIAMNPISSIGGQAVRGNFDYLKSFVNNLGYYGDGSGWVD